MNKQIKVDSHVNAISSESSQNRKEHCLKLGQEGKIII